jgi:uncharacterized RDD family membrane protein YckC
MFCPACGTSAGTHDRFCQHCGNPLPEGSAAAIGESAPAVPDFSPVPPPPVPPPWVAPSGGPPPVAAPIRPPAMPTQFPPPPYGAAPVYSAYPPSPPPWQNVAPAPGARLASFGAPLARWWQRVGSMVLDVLIVGVPLLIVNAMVTSAFGTVRTVRLLNGTYGTQRTIQGPAHIVILIVTAAIGALYFAFLNGTRTGQTIGNRAPDIAVRDAATGEVIGFKRALLRWFIRFALYSALVLPGLLNDLFPLWDGRNQTIADKAARSVVIRLK